MSRGLLFAFAAAAPLLAPVTGHAQAASGKAGSQTPPGAQGGLGEVVVTAQFRAQNLQKTPLAITAENAAMMEARSQTSITDVAKEAPNVTIEPAPQGFGNSAIFSIRGISQTDFNFALEPGVGTYIDDVYYSTVFGSLFDLLDLDRVEILRGPQGTLAGQNSIGGAVKLYSKKADASQGGYLEATTGSLSRLDLRGSADMVLVPDKLFLRISGISEHRDGYVTRYDYACTHPGSGYPSYSSTNSCVLGKEGGIDEKALRASLRWVPADNFEVNLIFDGEDDNNQAAASSLLYLNAAKAPANKVGATTYYFSPQFQTGDLYSNYSAFTDPTSGRHFPAVSTDKGWGVSADIDWKPADHLDLKSITAFRQYVGEFGEDLANSPLAAQEFDNHVSHHQLSEEVRLSGDAFDRRLEYTVGGFYFHSISYLRGEVDIPSSNLDFLQNDPVPSDDKAGFVHAAWRVTDKLTISGGTRYTDESKTYNFGRLNTDGSVPSGARGTTNALVASLNGTSGRYAASRWDYRAEADYQWTPDLMTYFQYSTGFKGGGVNPRPFIKSQEVPFGPETLDAYEIGLKSQLFDRRVRANFAAFYNEYNAIQETSFSCPAVSPVPSFPCALPINAGDGVIKGLEGEIEARPLPGLEVDASASYLDFHFTKVNSTYTTITLADQLPYSPKYRASLGVQYAIDLPSHGDLIPRLDYAYQSAMYGAPSNSPLNRIAGYGLLNGRITYRPDAVWEAAVFATNLTGKRYVQSLFDNSNSYGIVEGQPGRPREFGVSLKRTF